MKRLMIYFSVLVGCLFIGLTTYYMVKNYEYITVYGDDIGNEIHMNVGEDRYLTIVHEMKQTELSYTISDDTIVSFDLSTGKIHGLVGGETLLTINTENDEYGPFEFTIYIGDGSSSNPFYINSAEDLAAIGGTRTYSEDNFQTWGADCFYSIKKDITLVEEWTPLCGQTANGFTGELQGNLHTISGLSITTNQTFGGLFAVVSNTASIDSIIFENPSLIARFDAAGVVAGVSTSSTITKIAVKNAIINAAPYDTTNNEGFCMVGGIVGVSQGAYIGLNGTTPLIDRSIITMCSFEGTIATLSTTASVIFNIDYASFMFGGISGFALGSTIHDTKAVVNFEIDSSLAPTARAYNREQATPTGLCIDVGGIAGTVYENNIKNGETPVGTIYPIIKNNLAIVEIDNIPTSAKGIVGHLPVTTQFVSAFDGTPAAQRIFGNYFYTTGDKITTGGSTLGNATTKIENEILLKTVGTYMTDSSESWDINDATSPWLIEENTAPYINMIGLESSFNFDQDKYTISSYEEFLDYYSKMTSSSNILQRYWLRQSYVLNCDITFPDNASISEWKPIGGGDFFFKGTFDGNNHSITFNDTVNLKNTDSLYSSMGTFGVIATEGEVKNLTVVGIEIPFADYAGGIAGKNYGQIIDCVVKNIEIKDAKNAGFLVALNVGSIINTKEYEEEEITLEGTDETIISAKEDIFSVISTASFTNAISIKSTSEEVYAGGIVARNAGFIKNIRIRGSFTITGEAQTNPDSTAIKCFGGAVGYNTGSIENSYVEGANIYDYSKNIIYIGGFVGINGGAITNCHAGLEEGATTTAIYAAVEEGYQAVGGFAGKVKADSTVTLCFANISIEAYCAGGIANQVIGSVDQCYVKGSIKGRYLGGLVVNLALNPNDEIGGHITNCYTTVALEGVTADSILAGISVFTRYPGVVEKCYIACTFSGEGEKYYESYTNTRAGFTNWINSWAKKDERLGTITKVIINTEVSGTQNTEVQQSKALISYNGQIVRYIGNADCEGTGLEGIFTDLGFVISSSEGWTLNDSEIEIPNGSETKTMIIQVPTLTLLEGLDGVQQIPEIPEVPEEPTPETPVGPETPEDPEAPVDEGNEVPI